MWAGDKSWGQGGLPADSNGHRWPAGLRGYVGSREKWVMKAAAVCTKPTAGGGNLDARTGESGMDRKTSSEHSCSGAGSGSGRRRRYGWGQRTNAARRPQGPVPRHDKQAFLHNTILRRPAAARGTVPDQQRILSDDRQRPEPMLSNSYMTSDSSTS